MGGRRAARRCRGHMILTVLGMAPVSAFYIPSAVDQSTTSVVSV